MQLSVRQVRRIVSEYNHSVATVAASYDSDQDDDSDLEEEHLEISLELYDAYEHAVSSALIRAPVLFHVGCNGFKHVLLVPSQVVTTDDLVYWSERERFFLTGLDGHVIPALSEALATM